MRANAGARTELDENIDTAVCEPKQDTMFVLTLRMESLVQPLHSTVKTPQPIPSVVCLQT